MLLNIYSYLIRVYEYIYIYIVDNRLCIVWLHILYVSMPDIYIKHAFSTDGSASTGCLKKNVDLF